MPLYIAHVDGYRRPSRKRNTAGLYFVFGHTEKKAKSDLQKTIGFGSAILSETVFPVNINELKDYGHIFREEIIDVDENSGEVFALLLKPFHATDPIQNRKDYIAENLIGIIKGCNFIPIAKNSNAYNAILEKISAPHEERKTIWELR